MASPGDPRGFQVALRFDPAPLPQTQGADAGTSLGFKQKYSRNNFLLIHRNRPKSPFPPFFVNVKACKARKRPSARLHKTENPLLPRVLGARKATGVAG